jgi:molybdate transport system substrate-binding protein
MSAALKGISSMATRAVLGELVDVYTAKTGRAVAIESVGGVDAAKRVRAGEAFDVVLLADDALAKLEAEGLVEAGSRVGFTLSALTAATRAGAPRLAFADEAAMREALLAARTVGYSTGPSGTYLLGLLKRWGIDEAMSGRMVQAPPGVPVGTMVARGDAEIGFQQMSEFIGVDGIEIADPLPPAIAYETLFGGAVARAAADAEGARAFLAFLASPETAAIKHRHGMAPG